MPEPIDTREEEPCLLCGGTGAAVAFDDGLGVFGQPTPKLVPCPLCATPTALAARLSALPPDQRERQLMDLSQHMEGRDGDR